MAVKHVTLRAWSDNSDVAPVKINQGDILSRTIIMTLLDSTGAPIDLALSSARVHFSKPDGTVVYLTASIVNAAAGIISVTLDSQCTAVPGLVKSIVQVTSPNGENMFCTGPKISVGTINVENSVASSNEFTALTEALAQVQNIANKADLNADGKVIQDPASYGQPNGGATLNAQGKVIQDPASYGQPGGAATLNADGLVAQGLAPVDHTTIALTAASFTSTLHLYKFGHLILAYCDPSWVTFGSFTAAADIATIPLEWSPPIEVALPVLNVNYFPNTTGGRILLKNGKVRLVPNDWSKSFEGHVVPVVFFK